MKWKEEGGADGVYRVRRPQEELAHQEEIQIWRRQAWVFGQVVTQQDRGGRRAPAVPSNKRVGDEMSRVGCVGNKRRPARMLRGRAMKYSPERAGNVSVCT